MTFRGLEIRDLEILGMGSWTEEAGFRAIDNGLGPAPAAPAYGPGTEGAGIRVCGYAIKNSGLIVEVNSLILHDVCVKEPRVRSEVLKGIGDSMPRS